MSSLEIRSAMLKDARRISYLIKKNTAGNPNGYTPEQKAAWKAYNTPAKIKKQLSERDWFCAFERNKLVGTIGLRNNEVVGFYVSFAKRKKGIGAQLYAFIEKEAKQRNIKSLDLTATPSAISFYQSKGFHKIKEVIVSIGPVTFRETIMKKNL